MLYLEQIPAQNHWLP